MILHEILIPMLHRDGIMYPLERHANFLKAVAGIAGGYSVAPSIEGYWKDPKTGEEYRDTMIPVRVGVETAQQWADIVTLAALTFDDQLSLMHYVVSHEIVFTEPAAIRGAQHAPRL